MKNCQVLSYQALQLTLLLEHQVMGFDDGCRYCRLCFIKPRQKFRPDQSMEELGLERSQKKNPSQVAAHFSLYWSECTFSRLT